MCDPVSITMAVVAVVGGVMQADAANKQGKYQERVAENNAVVADRAAKDSIRRGEEAEQSHRMQVAQMISKQRAAGAANGVDIQGGSMLNMLGDTAMMGELDALTIRSNAANEAYGHTVGAQNSRAQGQLDRFAGKAKATSTLLTTAGKTASIWQNAKAS